MGSKYLIVFPLVCAISCTAGCKQRPKHEARPAAAATAGMRSGRICTWACRFCRHSSRGCPRRCAGWWIRST